MAPCADSEKVEFGNKLEEDSSIRGESIESGVADYTCSGVSLASKDELQPSTACAAAVLEGNVGYRERGDFLSLRFCTDSAQIDVASSLRVDNAEQVQRLLVFPAS